MQKYIWVLVLLTNNNKNSDQKGKWAGTVLLSKLISYNKYDIEHVIAEENCKNNCYLQTFVP